MLLAHSGIGTGDTVEIILTPNLCDEFKEGFDALAGRGVAVSIDVCY